jgi:hypothetical protein
MREWILAGMAQNDRIHLTLPGYRMIGDAVFRDLMNEYREFVTTGDAVARRAPSEGTHPVEDSGLRALR